MILCTQWFRKQVSQPSYLFFEPMVSHLLLGWKARIKSSPMMTGSLYERHPNKKQSLFLWRALTLEPYLQKRNLSFLLNNEHTVRYEGGQERTHTCIRALALGLKCLVHGMIAIPTLHQVRFLSHRKLCVSIRMLVSSPFPLLLSVSIESKTGQGELVPSTGLHVSHSLIPQTRLSYALS